MARLTGDIKLEGTLGDVTFYKAEDRYLARMKTGVDRKRFKKDPAFGRSRECSRVFGQASRAAHAFKIAFSLLPEDFPCKRFNSAMTGALVKTFSAKAGSGTPADGINPDNLSLTTGFEFNWSALLGEVFQIPWQSSINREMGTAQLMSLVLTLQGEKAETYTNSDIIYLRLGFTGYLYSDIIR